MSLWMGWIGLSSIDDSSPERTRHSNSWMIHVNVSWFTTIRVMK